MRFFVAVDLEPGLRDTIRDIQKNVAESGTDVKMVKPENLHFTLKFLGELEPEQLPGTESRIKELLKGTTQFRLSVGGLGYFGSPRSIRVVWVGVKDGREQLLALMGTMGKGLNSIRKDSFSPAAHLTIGRVRSARNVNNLLETINSLKDVKVGEMLVKEIRLKQSVLNRDGPAYSDVKVFPLPAKP